MNLRGARARIADRIRQARIKKLFGAVRRGRYDTVADFLGRGGDPNTALSHRCWSNHTLLMTAATTLQEDIVRLLLAAGADVDAREQRYGGLGADAADGRTALLQASCDYFPQVETRPTNLPAMSSPLARVMTLLLDAGADPNAAVGDGTTALMNRADEGDTETMGLLLDRGAEIDRQNRLGWTALTIAAYRPRAEAARLLLQRGADPNLRNAEGNTPLIEAVLWAHRHHRFTIHRRYDAVVETLVACGAALDARDREGRTPLELALELGEVRLAPILRGAGT